MSPNAYAPPHSELSDRPRPLAPYASLALAAVGVVLFWGTFVAIRVLSRGYHPANALWIRRAIRAAVVAHLAGIATAWAGPRGARALPAGANAVALTIMLGLVGLFRLLAELDW